MISALTIPHTHRRAKPPRVTLLAGLYIYIECYVGEQPARNILLTLLQTRELIAHETNHHQHYVVLPLSR